VHRKAGTPTIGNAEIRAYYLGKLMRQAKPDDVFTFVTLAKIRALFR
jgi:hypothetical protein